jgi:hypothetical protein
VEISGGIARNPGWPSRRGFPGCASAACGRHRRSGSGSSSSDVACPREGHSRRLDDRGGRPAQSAWNHSTDRRYSGHRTSGLRNCARPESTRYRIRVGIHAPSSYRRSASKISEFEEAGVAYEKVANADHAVREGVLDGADTAAIQGAAGLMWLLDSGSPGRGRQGNRQRCRGRNSLRHFSLFENGWSTGDNRLAWRDAAAGELVLDAHGSGEGDDLRRRRMPQWQAHHSTAAEPPVPGRRARLVDIR